jgi:tight adherence protein B
VSVAALALALAALVSPGSPRSRIVRADRGWGGRRRMPAAVLLLAGPVAVVLLPGPVAVASGVLVGTLVVLRRRRAAHRSRIGRAAALAAALDVLVAELRVGAHPVAALGTAAEHGDGPVARALTVVAARAALGADVAVGLRQQGRRCTPAAYWDRMALCWQLAQDQGLAIAALMAAAQRDIVERERFRGRVDAGMAGARATAAILAGLPLLGVLLGVAIGADPVSFLLSGGVGGGCLVTGCVLVCAGLLWSERITSRVAA